MIDPMEAVINGMDEFIVPNLIGFVVYVFLIAALGLLLLNGRKPISFVSRNLSRIFFGRDDTEFTDRILDYEFGRFTGNSDTDLPDIEDVPTHPADTHSAQIVADAVEGVPAEFLAQNGQQEEEQEKKEPPGRIKQPTFGVVFSRLLNHGSLTNAYFEKMNIDPSQYVRIANEGPFQTVAPTEVFNFYEGPEADPDRDYETAVKFFTFDIPVSRVFLAEENRFSYEDLDATNLAMTFPDDNKFHAVITEYRRAINKNIRKLSVYSSGAFALAIGVYFFFVYPIETRPEQGIFGTSISLTDLIAATSLWLLVYFICGILSYMYRNAQDRCGKAMNFFITTYFNYLRGYYDRTMGPAFGQQDIGSPQELDKTSKGVTCVVWHVIRVYCLEMYLRSTFYQIMRNSSNYMFLIPIAYVVFVATFFYFYHVSTTLMEAPLDLWIGILLGVLSLPLVTRITAKALNFLPGAIRENGWPQFNNLNFAGIHRAVLNKYATVINNMSLALRGSSPPPPPPPPPTPPEDDKKK